jgi:hypothetical protein
VGGHGPPSQSDVDPWLPELGFAAPPLGVGDVPESASEELGEPAAPAGLADCAADAAVCPASEAGASAAASSNAVMAPTFLFMAPL